MTSRNWRIDAGDLQIGDAIVARDMTSSRNQELHVIKTYLSGDHIIAICSITDEGSLVSQSDRAHFSFHISKVLDVRRSNE
jgi:hypothetical protein